ncbi:ribonuclease H-like protein, partial [Punctularia strigosozonata HHB-11173 SS5]|uniref:ribonuclease H-like protein n=1 Tax=Punctularia strigosozonata (strain HHB-11173) TaxID=741275 RepID=UPI00044162CD
DGAHRAIGHLGANKTTEYLRRYYWWPKIAADVDLFCKSCHLCQTAKDVNRKPEGLLHSLPIPSRPWGSVAMDFLGPFPKSRGHDYLWVIICRLTGMVHLVPCNTKTTASELAYLFLKEVVQLHGVPDSIVSDRDSKFNSKFWRELHRLMGTRLLMSTAFHPQTDGVTERANRTVSQILCSFVRPDQTDWADMLALTEFAMNAARSETTGYSPFELNYGYIPRMLDVLPAEHSAPGVREFMANARDCLERAHDAIIGARVRQAHHANRQRRDHVNYTPGDLVYISTTNLSLPLKRARKLAPRFIGPFKIIKAFNESSVYEIELPTDLRQRRVHPRFHISKLRPHVPN